MYRCFQAVNNVGDQTLLLGEEGEKLRWFLLPSEAAQLLSGKQLAHFPVSPPFTPLKWKNGSCVSEGTNLTGADFMEPSDGTYTSSVEKCSSNLTETIRSSRDNVKESEVANCNCVVNGETCDTNVRDSISNGEKCEERELSALQGMGKCQDPVQISNTKSLVDEKCSSAKAENENLDTRHEEGSPWIERRPDRILLQETGVCNFSEEEEEIKTYVPVDEKTLSNGHDPGPVSNETPAKRDSITDDPASSTDTSEDAAVTRDSDSIMDSKVVCQRKPRKKKQNEVIPGKPQFHHPPKSIFKPTVQVRKP